MEIYQINQNGSNTNIHAQLIMIVDKILRIVENDKLRNDKAKIKTIYPRFSRNNAQEKISRNKTTSEIHETAISTHNQNKTQIISEVKLIAEKMKESHKPIAPLS